MGFFSKIQQKEKDLLNKMTYHKEKGGKLMKKVPKITVPLPEGKIGISFTGKTQAVVSSVKKNGPMDGKPLKTGYIAETLTLDNGIQYTNFNKAELGKFLKESADNTDRTLTFVMKHNTGEIELDIPASEEIGFGIIETGGGQPIIWDLSPDFKHMHTVSAGMVVDTVILPNSYEMHAYSAEEFKSLLSATSSMEGRKVILKNKLSKTLSERSISFSSKTVELPVGDLKKLGIHVKGSTATVHKVDENSPFRSEIFPGMIVAACRIPNGTDYTNLPAYLLTEILGRTQKMEKRLLHLVGPDEYVEEEPMLKFYPEVLGTSMDELGITFTYNEKDTDFNQDGKTDLAAGFFVDKVEDKDSSIFGLDGLGLISVSWRNPDEEDSNTKMIKSQADIDKALLVSAGCNRVFNFNNVERGYMPDESVVVLPPMAEGDSIGCVVSGQPPQIIKIEEDSPLNEAYVMPGMFVSKLTIDSDTYENLSSYKLMRKLKESNDSAGRLLKCVKSI